MGDTWKWLEKPLEGVLFYYDGAIAGYLLICIAAAFLSTASFQEVMSGTEQRLIRTKFKDTSGSQLFSQAAFIVQALITFAFIGGPVLGGCLNDAVGIEEACLTMSIIGAGFLIYYTIGGIFVHFTSHQENTLNLDESIDGGLNRSRGGDELGKLLRTLNDDQQSLIKKKTKATKRYHDQEGEIETLDSQDESSTNGEDPKKYQ